MLTRDLQNKIEKILDEHDYYGLSPLEIAEKNNIKVYETSLDPQNSEIFSGSIMKNNDNNQIEICINKDDPRKRKNFSVAHELGHFFLHFEDINQGIVSYRRAYYNKYSEEELKKEEEANNFAAEILMPRERFVQLYKSLNTLPGISIAGELSNYFDVSHQAIDLRIHNLRKAGYL